MKKIFLATIILLFSGGFKSVICQSVQGFFIDDWQPKQVVIPNFSEAIKPESDADVKVTLSLLDTIAKVSPYVFGNNVNTYSTIMHNNTGLVNHIRDLNPHVLRYPGGNLSNEFFWDLPANQRPSDIPSTVNPWCGMDPSTWTMSVNNYYKLLEMVGCTGIITLNYSYARYGLNDDPVAQAAHYAADWVRYDNGRTKFWEIGNENFGNWQQGYNIDTSLNKDNQPKTINGGLYGQHCRVFIDSLRAAAAENGHTIYIGVQAWESETSWDPVQTNWNELMMPLIADKADYYIVHNYYTPYDDNSNAQVILNTYKKSHEFKTSVIADLAEAGYGPAPLALTEWNIFAVRSKQQVSHINGIHSVLVTGELIKDQYGLATRWNLANGWSNGDDHGTFSQGNEPGIPKFEPRPVFYYLTYMQRYFGDVMLKSSVSGSSAIVSYASAFQNGPLGVVVVNKSTAAKTVKIETGNFTPGNRYYWYTLEGGILEGEFSRQVFVNNQGPTLVAGGPSNYNDIPAWSASTEGGITIEAEPYSVNYIIVEGFKTGIQSMENSGSIIDMQQNYPNPFSESTQISYSLKSEADVKIRVCDINGQHIKTLVEKFQQPSKYLLKWNGDDETGTPVSQGIYILKVEVSSGKEYFNIAKQLSLIR
ncbi:MAG: T9SS type A sorting domain-containing protein [Draconibacterium sp.]